MSVVRLAENELLIDRVDSRSSASKNMLSRVRKTQKFQGSSSGCAFSTRRAPSGPAGRADTCSCWPSGVWAAYRTKPRLSICASARRSLSSVSSCVV